MKKGLRPMTSATLVMFSIRREALMKKGLRHVRGHGNACSVEIRREALMKKGLRLQAFSAIPRDAFGEKP